MESLGIIRLTRLRMPGSRKSRVLLSLADASAAVAKLSRAGARVRAACLEDAASPPSAAIAPAAAQTSSNPETNEVRHE